MKSRFLVIEDNEQNLYLIRFLLEKRGHEVVAAMGGPTGVELAGKANPAVILLDIQLPGMDGYAVAEALRKHPASAEIPIIAVTSYAMPGDREKALESGCTGYIEKPITPETFIEEVEQYLPGGGYETNEGHSS